MVFYVKVLGGGVGKFVGSVGKVGKVVGAGAGGVGAAVGTAAGVGKGAMGLVLLVGNCGTGAGFLIILVLLAKGDNSFSESIFDLLLTGGITLAGGFKFATCGLVWAKGSANNRTKKKQNFR